MHFGVFVEEIREGVDQVQAFRDIFETADRAEAWGIDCVWLGEIHFNPSRSVIDRITEVRDELGLDGIIAEPNPGGRIPPELETRSLRLLTHEVLPAFR